MRFLSTKVHGILDYVTSPALLLVPSLLGRNPHTRTLCTAMGAGALAYSMLTKYELGVYKLLPMPAHLAMDAASGAMLAGAAPFLKDKPAATATLIGVGLFEIAAALTTKTEPPVAEEARWFFQQAA